MSQTISPARPGRFSPLRYPGGKGKLARFVADIIRLNKLTGGVYVEPYAGGAAVALELLLTGLVRKIHINDLNKAVHSFWFSVLNDTDEFIELVRRTEVSIETWLKAKKTFSDEDSSGLNLAFATFFLNRTNRSGILNGGAIGGKHQTGAWKIDARYNVDELCHRIARIAKLRKRIVLTRKDAISLLVEDAPRLPEKALIYLDPPYYRKGRDLYYDFYRHDDHVRVAEAIQKVAAPWIVSYDDVEPIHSMYVVEPTLRYTIGYSARARSSGAEAMFFSPGLLVPQVRGSMVEIERVVESSSALRAA